MDGRINALTSARFCCVRLATPLRYEMLPLKVRPRTGLLNVAAWRDRAANRSNALYARWASLLRFEMNASRLRRNFSAALAAAAFDTATACSGGNPVARATLPASTFVPFGAG